MGKMIKRSYPLVSVLLGAYYAFKCRKDLYPLTFEYLNSVNESVNDFQKCRVRNVLVTKFKNQEVTVSKIAEVDGVRQFIREGIGDIGECVKEMVQIHNGKNFE
ncbi:hypothetical protein [Pseudobacillus badius]|uniref:hypothetical protein n=1 Tax=Bacillus badius TaxID=1455 RepID=UPI003D330F84